MRDISCENEILKLEKSFSNSMMSIGQKKFLTNEKKLRVLDSISNTMSWDLKRFLT